MDPEMLVTDYLGDLEAAAAELPARRRAELVGDIREHIGLALAEAGEVDEGAVRAVLERLGPPDQIVAAEAGQPGLSAVDAGFAWRRRDLVRLLDPERMALLLLTVGAVLLPFLGPLLGLWILASVPSWTLTQKRTATLIVLVGLALPAWILIPTAMAGEFTNILTTSGIVYVFVPLAGMVAAVYLIVSTSLSVTVPRRR